MLLLSPRGYFLLSFPPRKTPERYATREKEEKRFRKQSRAKQRSIQGGKTFWAWSTLLLIS